MNALSGTYIPAARPHALPLKAIALFCGLVLGSFLCMANLRPRSEPRVFLTGGREFPHFDDRLTRVRAISDAA